MFDILNVILVPCVCTHCSLDTSSSIELDTIPSDVVLLAGQNASFTCEPTAGNETYNITWLKNGRRARNRHWHPSGTELLVTNVRDHKDCANITCVVSNEDGDEVTLTATLTVISKSLYYYNDVIW